MIFDSIRRRLGMFDSNGLRYSLEHLNSIKKEILNYDIVKQAAYADAVTVNNCNNHDFIVISLLDIKEQNSGNYADINATSIGNLAYIHLFCKNKQLSDLAFKRLNLLKTKYAIKNCKAVHCVYHTMIK